MKVKQEDYKGYDDQLSKKLNMTIEEMYGRGLFKKRNLSLVEMMENVSNVFEFASCYGFLALEVMKRFPDVNYLCTNFLPEVVEYTKNQGVNSFIFDANDIPNTDLSKYDTFVCTSLEHLENDIEIIQSLPTSELFFCATNMDDPTHVWYFENLNDIFERYDGIMRIVDTSVFKFKDRVKIIGRGLIYDRIKS